MSQSSINKRANGTSRHGNELGNRHSGPAPRNRNNPSRPNSNSEQTRATSPGPEPWTDDHNRGPANARASNGQQPGNRSNTERDRPRDSETRKRKLNEVIAEALFSSSKKIRSEYVFFFFFFYDLLSHIPSQKKPEYLQASYQGTRHSSIHWPLHTHTVDCYQLISAGLRSGDSPQGLFGVSNTTFRTYIYQSRSCLGTVMRSKRYWTYTRKFSHSYQGSMTT